MDFPDYNFENIGLKPDDFKSFPDDGFLLPICWLDDEGHFLSIP